MKNHPHEPTVNELNEYVKSQRFLYASSSKQSKKLMFDAMGNFYVWHKKKMIYETRSPRAAIHTYNGLT